MKTTKTTTATATIATNRSSDSAVRHSERKMTFTVVNGSLDKRRRRNSRLARRRAGSAAGEVARAGGAVVPLAGVEEAAEAAEVVVAVRDSHRVCPGCENSHA
jgi:hypothetical protein